MNDAQTILDLQGFVVVTSRNPQLKKGDMLTFCSWNEDRKVIVYGLRGVIVASSSYQEFLQQQSIELRRIFPTTPPPNDLKFWRVKAE
jgi:hypothetical protein